MKSSINPRIGLRKSSNGSAFTESVQDGFGRANTSVMYSDRDLVLESSSPQKNAVMEVNA
jgi:hypothetical protein